MSFEQALALTVSPAVEGGFSVTRSDPGNWTGGRVGDGTLLGTMCGISAAFLWSLPETDDFYGVNPRTLTTDQIAQVYQTYFWNTLHCDDLAPPVAGLLFDAGVNQGDGFAARCLQGAVGVTIDGILGARTLAAAAAADPKALHAQIAIRRDAGYRSDAQFPLYGSDWLRRLFLVVAQTAAFT